jgi:hypothetical protein
MSLPTTTLRKTALATYALALTAAMLSRLVPIICDQLVAPFDLISEGPHLSAISAVRDGFNIYAPESYTDLPFHIIPYVPLLHALVAMLPADPTNPFLTGRVLSMLFMCGAAASLFVITRPRDWLCIPLIACACFFLIRPVTGNTAYLRSDPAGLFFSVTAVVTLSRRTPTTRMAVFAGVLCAIALACKQSFVAATATCFLYLLIRSTRRALVFASAEAAVLGALATAATLRWGTGFWFCVLLPATRYPRDWPSFVAHWQDMLKQPLFSCLVLMVLLLSFSVVKRSRAALFTDTPYALYVLISFAAQSSALSGIGASNHYFIEPVLVALLWLVFSTTRMPFEQLAHWKLGAGLTVIAICVILEFRYAEPAEYRYTTAVATAEHIRNRDWVIAETNRRGIPQGQLLNLKNSPVTFDYPGQMNVNDPYLFFVLWETRQLSTEPLLRAISNRYFDAVFVAPGLVSGIGQGADRPLQNVLRVLFQHYQLAIHGADVNVLTPRRVSLFQGGTS